MSILGYNVVLQSNFCLTVTDTDDIKRELVTWFHIY